MAECPKISIITPSFNQGRYIEKTLDSVLAQGYPNLEFIVIDGGSQDETTSILKKYDQYLAYWVSEPDRGQSHAINKGMRRATGDILTWLNSDDWYRPGTLQRFSELLGGNPSAGMVVGAGRILNERGDEIYYKVPTATISVESLYEWMDGGNFMQPSSAFTRSAWQAAGPIDENVHMAMDLDLWLRMAKAGVEFLTVDELFADALSHPNAKTTAFESLMVLDCSVVITRHGGESHVRKRLEEIGAKLAWYEGNYERIVNHPILRLLRPILKRLGKEGSYWNESIPPWVKN